MVDDHALRCYTLPRSLLVRIDQHAEPEHGGLLRPGERKVSLTNQLMNLS
jgi:hypothetical protein